MSGRRMRRAVGTALLVVSALLLVSLTWSAWFPGRSPVTAAEKAAPQRLWQPFPLPSAVVEKAAELARRPVRPGDTIGRITIPAISLDLPLVEMDGCDDQANLDRGPAHIGGTALPGAAGNCGIAGHRSTFTRPFERLGSLTEGDEITLAGRSGATYSYRVSRIWVVSPDQVSVLDPTPEPSVTMVTCHPPGSERSRLIIRAVLDGGPPG